MTKPPRLDRLSMGERIAYARTKYRLNRAQLGANVGVTRAAISLYEHDKIRPRPEIMERLAEMFHSEQEWFEAGRGKAPDPLDAPVIIHEINLGHLTTQINDLRDLRTGREWRLPTAMFEGTPDPDHMVAICAPNAAGPIQPGDRVVIDTLRWQGEGIFLVIDAAGAQLRPVEALEEVRIIGLAVAYFRSL